MSVIFQGKDQFKLSRARSVEGKRKIAKWQDSRMAKKKDSKRERGKEFHAELEPIETRTATFTLTRFNYDSLRWISFQ